MSLTDSNGSNNMVMPVSPMYGGGNGGWGNSFGGDGAWWLLVLFLFAFNGNGWGNGFGGGGAMPYIMNNTTNNDVQRGFDQQSVMGGINGLTSGVTNGFAGVNQALCSGFAGVNATINGGFAAAESADNARQMANMQQAFNTQTAITGSLSNLQSQLAQCCCDNRLATANLNSTILSENCADRAAISDGLRDVIANNTANTTALLNTINGGIQSIQDKLCQQEIDALKSQNANLQTQINLANLQASQTAQTARLLSDNQAQTQALEQYLNPAPIPAYIVQNPGCCNQAVYAQPGCNNFQCGCGN